ncbi:MAG: hypothetical protein K9G43_10685, partial [Rhodobacteraceae bacterium]|nr:hypothetical protein [Paracoccaceae bacterium]
MVHDPAETGGLGRRDCAGTASWRLQRIHPRGVIAPMSPERPPMIESLHPVLPKTPILGLRVHVGRSGICIGDPATLLLTETGEVALMAVVKR